MFHGLAFANGWGSQSNPLCNALPGITRSTVPLGWLILSLSSQPFFIKPLRNPRSGHLGFGVCLDRDDRRISDLRSLGSRPVYPDRALASYRPFHISPFSPLAHPPRFETRYLREFETASMAAESG